MSRPVSRPCCSYGAIIAQYGLPDATNSTDVFRSDSVGRLRHEFGCDRCQGRFARVADRQRAGCAFGRPFLKRGMTSVPSRLLQLGEWRYDAVERSGAPVVLLAIRRAASRIPRRGAMWCQAWDAPLSLGARGPIQICRTSAGSFHSSRQRRARTATLRRREDSIGSENTSARRN
jgi:hypothetical protein